MKTTLVTAQELHRHPEWRVLDCRHDLGAPEQGRMLYLQGHIPRALHAHLDQDLSGVKTGGNGRHPLPDAQAFMAWLGRCGLRPGDQIVAYDDSGGIFAARLWWMLRWVGHEAVAVLDGGQGTWLKNGLPLTTEIPCFAPTEYHASPDDRRRVDAAYVEANLGQPHVRLLDARAANRYAGRDETIDPVAGHIPGALNRPYSENLAPDGRFKSAVDLRAEFDALLGGHPASAIISQCGSGVTACHNLLALEIAGLQGARLYPGSWSEWCSDPRRPVAVGAQP